VRATCELPRNFTAVRSYVRITQRPIPYRSLLRCNTRLTLLACAAVSVACQRDVTAPGGRAASIAITPPAATVDALGASQSFAAVIRDRYGSLLEGQQPEWTVSASSVASVSGDGTATA
jgi:hypothetical protein